MAKKKVRRWWWSHLRLAQHLVHEGLAGPECRRNSAASELIYACHLRTFFYLQKPTMIEHVGLLFRKEQVVKMLHSIMPGIV